jgi:hypothetical protein
MHVQNISFLSKLIFICPSVNPYLAIFSVKYIFQLFGFIFYIGFFFPGSDEQFLLLLNLNCTSVLWPPHRHSSLSQKCSKGYLVSCNQTLGYLRKSPPAESLVKPRDNDCNVKTRFCQYSGKIIWLVELKRTSKMIAEIEIRLNLSFNQLTCIKKGCNLKGEYSLNLRGDPGRSTSQQSGARAFWRNWRRF